MKTNEQHAHRLDSLFSISSVLTAIDDDDVRAALRAGAAALRAPQGYAVLTEAQAVKLFSAAFAMGHAVIPGMPMVEDVVRRCHSDIADVVLEVEMPDIADAVIRQGQREALPPVSPATEPMRPSVIDLTVPRVPTRPLCTLHDLAVERCLICRETRRRLAAQPVEACVWTESGDGPWEGSCGVVFDLVTGTPAENQMLFCPRCGKPLSVPATEQE